MNTSSKSVIVEHCGCKLSATVCGEGPPVVFIQGTGLHGAGWLPQVEELSSHFRCLYFDNRGMGQSQPVGAAITVEQMAKDTLVLMDALKWESAHVVGHSLGGLIALHLALSARKRVRSLSLLCTFSNGKDATKLTGKMLWLGLRTYVGTRQMRRRAFTKMVLPPGLQADRDAWAKKLAPLFGHDLADHPPIVLKQMGAMNAYDATPRLNELVGMPALVVGAGHDLIARPDVVEKLAADIKESRLVRFKNAAHGVTIQCAGEVNALLHEHFNAVEKTSPPLMEG